MGLLKSVTGQTQMANQILNRFNMKPKVNIHYKARKLQVLFYGDFKANYSSFIHYFSKKNKHDITKNSTQKYFSAEL